MIRKIIAKWERRYQKFYAEHRWRLILDLGIILIVLILLSSWWLITSSRSFIDRRLWSGFQPIKHKETIYYKEMPLDWQVVFKPLIINGSAERLTAAINYKNKADKAIIISYSCRLSGSDQLLPIKEVSDSNFNLIDGQLTAELAAQQTGQLAAVWNWADQPQAAGRQVKIVCQLQTKLGEQAWLQPDQEFSFKKSAMVKVSAGAYFYTAEGDQVGVGPIPPIVGLPTSYLVTWTLENSGGDLSDVQLSAKLADNATWQGEAGMTGGNLFYDDVNHKVNWRIAEWPQDATKKQASFYVAITPDQTMVGQIVPLVQAGHWKAADSWSEKTWQGDLPVLSSNLDYDSRTKGQGQVQAGFDQ